MSNLVMGQVWRLDMATGRKMVLLAFADAADDNGVTWIAIESRRGKLDMRRKTSMSLRAIQGHIKSLEDEGYLERQENPGKGCLWIVRPTPAGFAGVWASTPADFAGGPADSAGNTSINHHEKERALRLEPPVDKCPVSGMILPSGLSLRQWEEFLDMRFALGKPIKLYTAGILLQKLADFGKRWHPGDIVDRSTVNGWADLYEPEEGRVTGVRPVRSGFVGKPTGLSEADEAEQRRINAIEDHVERRDARRLFEASLQARNGPAQIGRVIGELNLGLPFGRKKRKKG